MNWMGALIGGLIAGLVGAAVWGGIAYFTHYEIGWVAWGIGALVGFAVAKGAEGGNASTGTLAVVVSLLAICGGKYLAIQFESAQILGDSAMNEIYSTDEEMVGVMANEVATEREAAGQTIDWPDPPDPETADSQAYYPPDIWAAGQQRWDALSPQQQQQQRDDLRRQLHDGLAGIRSAFVEEAFWSSFGFMDLLFGGLAVVTAFQLGSKDLGSA